MSSAQKAATILPEMENYDIRVLQTLERGMVQYEVVPFKELIRYSGLNESELEHRLGLLHKHDLIYRQRDPYLGYQMNYNGYDLLALNSLVRGGFLEALGPMIGVGKEADIFQAITPEEKVVALKFHRLGRTSFRDTRRKRDYIADRRHVSWLFQSRLAAENEYKALELMYKAGVHVPEPHMQNRHCIVMQHIEGIQLNEAIKLDVPRVYLMDILENMRVAYGAGVIHTDLSEYNLLITSSGEIWIIDWPQYITRSHANADEFLERDIGNVVYFFKRKHGVDLSLSEALEIVKKGSTS